MHYTILCQTQHQVFIIPKTKATVSLTKEMLGQIEVTYFNGEERPKNKVGKIDVIGGDVAEMVDKIIYESICNITS